MLTREARGKDLAEEDYIRVLGELRYGREIAQEDYLRGLKELEYGKGLAEEDLEREKFRVERELGKSAAASGLFGSGIYQEELGEQLGDIQRGFERQYVGPESVYAREIAERARQYERQYGDDPESAYSRAVAEQERTWQRSYGDVDSEYAQRIADYQQAYQRSWGADSEYTSRIGGYETQYQRGLEDYQRQEEDVSRQWEREWGTGEYTPYSQRLFELEQEQRVAEEEAYTGREQQAYEMYLRQFGEGGAYYGYY